jgi:hypothetical protein
MEVSMKQAGIAAFTLAALFAVTPATAKMQGCTSENIAKANTDANAMPDGPRKMAMLREMGTANTAISKGDMRAACISYMRVQRMGTMMPGTQGM